MDFNLVQNNGEAAGQTVFHFHMHMIPRYKDDHAGILWTPGETTQGRHGRDQKAGGCPVNWKG